MAVPPVSKYVSEFVGTFFLVLTVGCNVLSGQATWGGLSIASVLMVSIYAFGNISGANFNPAVSISLALARLLGHEAALPLKDMAIYIVVQVLGAISAGIVYTAIFWDSFKLKPAGDFKMWQAGVVEMLYTFMLCFVVLNVALKRKRNDVAPTNQWYGLAIGYVIVAGAYGAGAVSGGCFNPAVAIGIDTSSKGFGYCIIYALWEIAGAILAAILFKVVRPDEFQRDDYTGIIQPARLPQKLISEFIGTYFLVLTVGLNVLAGSKPAALSIAASLMCMIYALGDISGANFNPAVTISIRLTGEISAADAGFYIVSQLIGGVAAAFTYAGIYQGKTFGLGPQKPHGWAEVAVAEIVFTFVLCYVVLCTAVNNLTKSKDMFGLAIGACVIVGGFAIGSVSGGSLNPAVSFGIAAAHVMGNGLFFKALIYTSFELVGGILAAFAHQVTHATESVMMPEGKDDV